jgi:hypothetical protein
MLFTEGIVVRFRRQHDYLAYGGGRNGEKFEGN